MGSNGDGLTVLGLRSQDVRGIKVINLKPRATGVVKVRGRNGQGKSSTLDSIELVLNGKDRNANSPVRHGADSASIVAELGNLIVKRVLKEDGTTKAFSVESMVNGATMAVKKPQDFLNSLIGSGIGFDPLEYASLNPAEQVDMLLGLVQLPRDPREIDKQRADLYGQRTLVNRELKSAEALLDATEQAPEGTPDEEVSVAEMLREFADAQVILAAHAKIRKAAADAQQEVGRVQEECKRDLETAEAAVRRLQAELKAAEEDLDGMQDIVAQMVRSAKDGAAQAAEKANTLVDPDLAEIQTRMQDAETVNKAVHIKQRRAEKAAEVGRIGSRSEKLTTDIEALDKERTDLLTAATFPLPDLSIEDVGGQSCVVYRGIPLADCSSSEKLRISLSIALGLNPKVRVVLIREGSLLDEEARTALELWATENEVQVWLELVGNGIEGEGFLIEDGTLVEG
jgi:DNA repair exonuclease SbcCD ATPase subunit